MRTLLSCAIILGLALAAQATHQKKANKENDVAIDEDKLVGKWEPIPIKGIKGARGPVREFTKDGKSYLGAPGGKGPRLEGTYKMDGNSLTITWAGAPGVPGEEHKYKIKKLTDKDLVLVEGKLTETLKRTK